MARVIVFAVVALATAVGVLLWLGEGDPARAIAPVRSAASGVVGPAD